jgi:hypothetical protein
LHIERISEPVGLAGFAYTTPGQLPAVGAGDIRRELSTLRWLPWQSEHGITFPDHVPPW